MNKNEFENKVLENLLRRKELSDYSKKELKEDLGDFWQIEDVKYYREENNFDLKDGGYNYNKMDSGVVADLIIIHLKDEKLTEMFFDN